MTAQNKTISNAPTPCEICQRLELWRQGQNATFIHEFEHSIFVLGDHQFHRGYSLILLKDHVRELHELESEIQTALFREVMIATRSLVKTFQPWKMNHSCYGNAAPHIHWHLFPRYDTAPDHTSHPWLHASEFEKHKIDSNAAKTLIQQIQSNLAVIIGVQR
jgi:diadenosine tetraphosphate (Ap4A) HIT family hydrolase